MGSKIVKNYPSPRLMEIIGATIQTPAEAIGELVANSFDARNGKEKLEISIDLRNDKIIIIDNGKGMTFDVLEKAVCIGEDMSKYIERGEGAKGHFGMGFKTSCATLGYFYEIYTRPVNDNVEYYTSFNIKEYSSRPNNADAWRVEIIDQKPSNKSPLKSAKYGTAFVISNLKDKNISADAVLKHMGREFKNHIEDGDCIAIINNSGKYEAKPEPYDFINGTRIDIDIKFGPGNKYHVTGWMALDTQIHNDTSYGFNIYRHKQLVIRHDKSWFRAHNMTSRIIGEVNMNFLDATFYKQGVQQSEDWNYVKIKMKEYLRPIVSASQKIKSIHRVEEVVNIVNTLRKEYGLEGEITSADLNIGDSGSQSGGGKGEKGKKGINDRIKNIVKEEALILENHGEIAITYFEKEESGDIKSPFDYVFSNSGESDKAELQVILFSNHPLWNKKTDNDVRKILATSDAIYRLLVEKLKIDPSTAVNIRNEWISKRSEGLK